LNVPRKRSFAYRRPQELENWKILARHYARIAPASVRDSIRRAHDARPVIDASLPAGLDS
jgi:hypothetical protein